jgi:acyl-homoserine lactone acylase PvdQ
MVTENNVARDLSNASRAGKRVLLVVLLMIAAGLFVQVGRSQNAVSDQAQPSQTAPTMLAVTGAVGRDTHGIYLIDTVNQTLCVYEYRPSQKDLRLLAARELTHDVQLSSYNTSPSPQEIRLLVEMADRADAEIEDLANPPAIRDETGEPHDADVLIPRVDEMP